MRRLRHLALLFLILYSAFAIGIDLHSHAGNDPFHNDCQLCQASNVALIQASVVHCAPQIGEFGAPFQAPEKQPLDESYSTSFGRAPPLL